MVAKFKFLDLFRSSSLIVPSRTHSSCSSSFLLKKDRVRRNFDKLFASFRTAGPKVGSLFRDYEKIKNKTCKSLTKQSESRLPCWRTFRTPKQSRCDPSTDKIGAGGPRLHRTI